MRNVNMEYVSSSNVESVGYDAGTNTLYVNYLNADIKGAYPFRKL